MGVAIMDVRYVPKRIYVPLEPKEMRALAEMAEQERREPRQQAALLIREELIRLGYLENGTEVTKSVEG